MYSWYSSCLNGCRAVFVRFLCVSEITQYVTLKITGQDIADLLQQMECIESSDEENDDIIVCREDDEENVDNVSVPSFAPSQLLSSHSLSLQTPSTPQFQDFPINDINPNPSRRVVTKKRNVYSIESANDLNNYNPIVLPEDEETCSVSINEDTGVIPKRNITWTTTPPVGPIIKEETISMRPDVKRAAALCMTPLSAWSWYFSDDLISELVNSTNKRIQNMMEIAHERRSLYYQQFTDGTEIKAFIGLVYMRGVLQFNHLNLRVLFSEKVGPPIFTATMSINRFLFLHANLTFDDIDTRKDRWELDKFTAFRRIFEIFNTNCASAVNPSDYLSLDETLYPCRVKVPFKQYNPKKLAKYGILYRSLNSARFPYTYQTAVYSGKPSTLPSPYYAQGISPTVKQLINDLEKHSSLDGVNISMDGQYTDFALFEWLLQKDITAIGIMTNRTAIPRQMSSVVGRNEFSYKVMWENSSNKMSLHSYVVNTKSKCKKNVLALASTPPLLGTTIDDNKNKPALLKLYDFTKGGADIVNQIIGAYSVNSRSKRWTISSFSYLLDTARVNSQTLWSLANGKKHVNTNSFDFALQLADDLVRPFIEKRSTGYLTQSCKNKIHNVLQSDDFTSFSATITPPPTSTHTHTTTPVPATTPAPMATPAPNAARIFEAQEPATASAFPRKRCNSCVTDLTQLEAGERRTKQMKMSKVASKCTLCLKSVCKTHYTIVCNVCWNYINIHDFV